MSAIAQASAERSLESLPTGWTWARLGDICDAINGRAFKSSEWRESGLPIVRIQNLKDPDAEFNYFAGELDDRHRVRHGDLLFAWSGTPGTSFGAHIWKGPEAALNQHIFNVKFDLDLLEPRYFCLALNQNVSRYVAQAQGGVGLAHITKSKFLDSFIPLAPKPKQLELVAELEKQFSRLDEAVANLKGVKASISRYRAAALSEAAGSDGQWPTCRIADLLRERIVNGLSVKESTTPTSVRALRLSAMSESGLNYADHRFLPVDPASVGDILVEEGDFFVSRGNGSLALVGRGATAQAPPFPVIFPDTMMRLRFTNAEVRRWVATLWPSRLVRRQLEQRVKTTAGIYKIAQPQVTSISLPLPPASERARIVAEVDRRLSIVREVEAAVGANLKRAQVLRQAVLARQFAGRD